MKAQIESLTDILKYQIYCTTGKLDYTIDMRIPVWREKNGSYNVHTIYVPYKNMKSNDTFIFNGVKGYLVYAGFMEYLVSPSNMYLFKIQEAYNINFRGFKYIIYKNPQHYYNAIDIYTIDINKKYKDAVSNIITNYWSYEKTYES